MKKHRTASSAKGSRDTKNRNMHEALRGKELSSSPETMPKQRQRSGSCTAQTWNAPIAQSPRRMRSSSFGHIFSKNCLAAVPTSQLSHEFSPTSSSKSLERHSELGRSHAHNHTKTLEPASDLIFDYVHGEIKHRPKTAFGTIVHEEIHRDEVHAKPIMEPTKKVLEPKGSDSEEEDSLKETLTADDFITQCIIESEQTHVKAAQKPTSSSAFDSILKEFMSANSSDSDSEGQQGTFRNRGFSLPATSLTKRRDSLVQSGKRVQILLPEA